MPAPPRKSLLASRRRTRPDEGEEEESVVGDFEDDSLSEGSAASPGDEGPEFEGSESSGDERTPAQNTAATSKSNRGKVPTEKSPVVSSKDATKPQVEDFQLPPDTEAMLHGVKADQQVQETEELRFEELAASENADTVQPAAVLPKAPQNENPAQRARREHQEYIRQRDANPAFVPNRGGFFLHDDRNSTSVAPTARQFGRGRGRGYGPPPSTGRAPTFNEPTNKPWAHDLHEEHENEVKQEPSLTKPPVTLQGLSKESNRTTVTPTAPNRTFSFTTVIGNVNVQLSLPGMTQRLVVSGAVKKHHTLLPQHRPPLRRDKPVRVSIPDTAPRYIFPSTDRSFIFIPRALRPNQQPYGRVRGRGSFHGSRRPSLYGSYTPSVAMSRKSSIGASTMREGIISPTDSIMSRHIPGLVDASRPVVRLPSVGPPGAFLQGPAVNGHGPMPIGLAPSMPMPQPMMYGNHSAAMHLHQPRPQKPVSLDDIESPASFHFKVPQQQQEQPFHQQVPLHIPHPFADDKGGAQSVQPAIPMPGATPLSHVPEAAGFAQGFQPYPLAGPGYYGVPFNNGGVLYPPMPDMGSFGLQMGVPALAPSFVPGSQSHPINYMPPAGPTHSSMTGNMMAHESNGMVYYYNPSAFGPDGQGQQFPLMPNGTMMPLANGVSAQAPFYFPPAPPTMFYPAQTG